MADNVSWKDMVDQDMAASARPRPEWPSRDKGFDLSFPEAVPSRNQAQFHYGQEERRRGVASDHNRDYGVPPKEEMITLSQSLPIVQAWVQGLPLMQQSVLMAAVRGPDGMAKRHPAKNLVRWYRRCIVLSAFEGKAITDPWFLDGGSFTGTIPQDKLLINVLDDFMDARDEMYLHYYAHMMHGAEIIGFKHPDEKIRQFWREAYFRMAHALHLWPELEDQMDRRLGDNEATWRERNDPSSTCSD